METSKFIITYIGVCSLLTYYSDSLAHVYVAHVYVAHVLRSPCSYGIARMFMVDIDLSSLPDGFVCYVLHALGTDQLRVMSYARYIACTNSSASATVAATS